jgi:TetR/AcrR family transcriptional regulator
VDRGVRRARRRDLTAVGQVALGKLVGVSARASGENHPRKRRPRRSADEQRKTILAAAREQFIKSGFAGTKMREIAAAADINDALLYRHFESKAQLFDHAICGPLAETVAHAFAPASGEEDVKALSQRFMGELLEAMREILPLLIVVLADAERGEEFYRKRLRPAIDEVVEATRANLELWEHQRFDPELVVRIAWGACWVLALDERLGGGPVLADDVVDSVLDIIWSGLRARVDP